MSNMPCVWWELGIHEPELCLKLFRINCTVIKGIRMIQFEQYIATLCIFLDECPRRRKASPIPAPDHVAPARESQPCGRR